MDDLSLFNCSESILFFVDCISLYFFHFLSITIFCLLLLYLDWVVIRLSPVSSIPSFPRDQSRDVTNRLGEGG